MNSLDLQLLFRSLGYTAAYFPVQSVVANVKDAAFVPGHGNPGPSEDLETKKTSIAVIIVVSVLASVLVVTALFGGFRYWQKKKRERDQAWFLKLFEERDDLEDELGLSNEF
jgi:hypothetical protein